MAESNLARSLFSGTASPAPRKKIVRNNTQESQTPPSSEVEVETAIAQDRATPNIPLETVKEPVKAVAKKTVREIPVESIAIAASNDLPVNDLPVSDLPVSDLPIDITTELTLDLPSNSLTDSESEINFKAELLEIELEALKQEIAELRQNTSDRESQDAFKQEYIQQLEAEIQQTQSSHTHAIGILKSQLEQAESTAQALQTSLTTQLEQNSQQQQEMLARIAQAENAAQLAVSQENFGATEKIEQLQLEVDRLTAGEQHLKEVLETTRVSLSECTKNLQSLHIQLSETQRQKEELESQLVRHVGIQALLQQSLHSSESEQAIAASRTQELEQQVRELQEQVLKQAGQASEYEAAVQHWKEQSVRHQHHALQLSAAIERLLEGKQNSKVVHSPDETPQRAEVQQFGQERPLASVGRAMVELPAFLVRSR
ncbi:hypothetical protein V2H45_17270 [Tumidithrix elongata RA019]|uniref:Uncharacterized protein n=1 Tax=Tumidithrix elongata BACA0141 TaxID=2716417 RepID=A0AAW9PTF3_9CYAN|nr:hypothetical protein [Tumidithrix elongata RA019]